MSLERIRVDAGFCDTTKLPRGPNGRALCRQCNEEVPKGRRSFCGNECIDQWKLKTDTGYQRARVLERDNGICMACKLDCVRLERAITRRWGDGFKRFYRLYMWASGRAVTTKFAPWRSLWEMDHVLPVSEGGGDCGLENLRTLCIWCHNEVTAKLRKRLARTRRREKRARGYKNP